MSHWLLSQRSTGQSEVVLWVCVYLPVWICLCANIMSCLCERVRQCVYNMCVSVQCEFCVWSSCSIHHSSPPLRSVKSCLSQPRSGLTTTCSAVLSCPVQNQQTQAQLKVVYVCMLVCVCVCLSEPSVDFQTRFKDQRP